MNIDNQSLAIKITEENNLYEISIYEIKYDIENLYSYIISKMVCYS